MFFMYLTTLGLALWRTQSFLKDSFEYNETSIVIRALLMCGQSGVGKLVA